MSATDPLPTPYDFGLNPAFAARLVGGLLVVVALVVLGTTVLVALAGWTPLVVYAVAVVGVVLVLGVGGWLRSRASVLHVDEDGYRVSLIRGAGVAEARWRDVEDAVTAHPRGVPCVVLRLRDGRTTSIPVPALAIDREELVVDLQRRLQRGHGLRPPG